LKSMKFGDPKEISTVDLMLGVLSIVDLLQWKDSVRIIPEVPK
jgi:hypothetical protein